MNNGKYVPPEQYSHTKVSYSCSGKKWPRLWLPFLLAGIVFIITGVIMYFSHQKNQTNTNQQQ